MADLLQVSQILDSGKVDEEDLQAALQAILFHQCLYEDWPFAPAYRLLARHLHQVQPILGAFGYRLTHHSVARMLVLEPVKAIYGVHMSRLRKDETTILLALRLLYAEGVSSLDEYGRVECDSDELHDRLRSAGDEPPPLPRLIEILKLLQRRGLVRVGERDANEQILPLTIMPGITVLVPDVYVEALVQWLENREPTQAPASGFVAIVAGHADDVPAEDPYNTSAAEDMTAEEDPDVLA
ncbi:MAG: DUF4194 domain-containing protein [Sphingomonas sp.]|jgi:hypothetical protein|uniref:DUF4194 domain-containing protein n=1 Tax=Sphingomonas sp. TaxID=28214 RepID=UPI0035628BD7